MFDNTEYLSQLNPQQRLAVEHTDGPVLILAGAGSGKTRTITYKIAHLIARGIARPEQILAVTFTNKAAGEMRDRVIDLLGGTVAAPLICTFHSLGVRLLRRHASLTGGYTSDFTICDVDEQKRTLKRLYIEQHLDNEEVPIDKARIAISRAKNKGWSPSEYLSKSPDFDKDLICPIFEAYLSYMRKLNAVDFDDLILLTVELLREHADLRQRYGQGYRYLLIDEYQDTNAPQYELVRGLTACHQNISAVGDEDQSIYGFRGADINNILRFEKDFPGARIIKLEQNYRSTGNILKAATALVSNNLERKHKVLWTEQTAGQPISLYVAADAQDEARFVASRARQHLTSGDKPIAVLYRTNFQSRQFEEAFRHFGISYRLVGSVSFYQRKEVKDALAYLRLARNHQDDVSLARVLNEPPRGIGQVTRDKLYALAAERSRSLWEVLGEALQTNEFSGRSHLALQRFVSVVERCGQAAALPLHLAVEQILDFSGYLEAVRQEASELATNRLQNLQELVNVAREYEDQEDAAQAFLDKASLYSESDEIDLDAEVTLMTLHNAKGLEFPVVFLAGCEEGLFPHSRAIVENDLEEERRICYVGLTRAQRKLYLTYSRSRRFYGRDNEELNSPSRFLHEIPSQLIAQESSPLAFARTDPATPGFSRQPVLLGSSSLKSPRPEAKPFPGKTFNSVDSVKKALERRKTAPPKERTLAPGAVVIHDKFGRGRILSVEDTGSDLKVSVQFPGRGIKKLLQSYAKLRLA